MKLWRKRLVRGAASLVGLYRGEISGSPRRDGLNIDDEAIGLLLNPQVGGEVYDFGSDPAKRRYRPFARQEKLAVGSQIAGKGR